jgi:hypothetical protein
MAQDFDCTFAMGPMGFRVRVLTVQFYSARPAFAVEQGLQDPTRKPSTLVLAAVLPPVFPFVQYIGR